MRPFRLVLFVLIASLPTEGCQPSSVNRKIVWVDKSGGERSEPEPMLWGQVYLSWPDGGSVAIVVPLSLGTENRSGPLDSRRLPERIVISAEEGAVYHNDEQLCVFPVPNNRCYILGNDLKLHDSGQSAEWLMGPPPEAGVYLENTILPNMRVGPFPDSGSVSPVETSRESAGQLDSPYVVRYDDACQYAADNAAFWKMAASLAFDSNRWILCSRWQELVYDGKEWNVVDSPDRYQEVRSASRWDVHLLQDRPVAWTTAYPRDCWEKKLNRADRTGGARQEK